MPGEGCSPYRAPLHCYTCYSNTPLTGRHWVGAVCHPGGVLCVASRSPGLVAAAACVPHTQFYVLYSVVAGRGAPSWLLVLCLAAQGRPVKLAAPFVRWCLAGWCVLWCVCRGEGVASWCAWCCVCPRPWRHSSSSHVWWVSPSPAVAVASACQQQQQQQQVVVVRQHPPPSLYTPAPTPAWRQLQGALCRPAAVRQSQQVCMPPYGGRPTRTHHSCLPTDCIVRQLSKHGQCFCFWVVRVGSLPFTPVVVCSGSCHPPQLSCGIPAGLGSCRTEIKACPGALQRCGWQLTMPLSVLTGQWMGPCPGRVYACVVTWSAVQLQLHQLEPDSSSSCSHERTTRVLGIRRWRLGCRCHLVPIVVCRRKRRHAYSC
jgi:hypothetical protein